MVALCCCQWPRLDEHILRSDSEAVLELQCEPFRLSLLLPVLLFDLIALLLAILGCLQLQGVITFIREKGLAMPALNLDLPALLHLVLLLLDVRSPPMHRQALLL